MKRHWIIVFVVILAGLAITAFFYAQPKEISTSPVRIPSRAEVVPPGSATNELAKTADEGQAPQPVKPNTLVRKSTEKLLEVSCPLGTDECKLQAIYDFVRTNIEFTERSIETPYIRAPAELLIYGRGDEMEIAMLLASMQRAAGFRNEIVRSPTSAWVRVYHGNQTVMIDPSCTGCTVMAARVTLRGDEIIYN